MDTEIHGMPASEYIKSQQKPEVEEKIEEKVEIVEEEIIEEEKSTDLTKEDIKELLKANKIGFHHALGMEKLVKLAIENKLL